MAYNILHIDGYTKSFKVKQYNKYYYTSWTQPKLYSNGTVGSTNYAVRANTERPQDSEYAYKAFDKNRDTVWSGDVDHKGLNDWVEFYSPVLLKATSLVFTNRQQWIRVFHNLEIISSLDGKSYTKICDYTNENINSFATWSVNFKPTELHYIRVKGTSVGKLAPGLKDHITISCAEIEVKAQQRSVKISTSDDYDFITYVPAILK